MRKWNILGKYKSQVDFDVLLLYICGNAKHVKGLTLESMLLGRIDFFKKKNEYPSPKYIPQGAYFENYP